MNSNKEKDFKSVVEENAKIIKSIASRVASKLSISFNEAYNEVLIQLWKLVEDGSEISYYKLCSRANGYVSNTLRLRSGKKKIPKELIVNESFGEEFSILDTVSDNRANFEKKLMEAEFVDTLEKNLTSDTRVILVMLLNGFKRSELIKMFSLKLFKKAFSEIQFEYQRLRYLSRL